MYNSLELLFPDKTKCVKCRLCAEICPMGIIRISADGFPKPSSCAYRLCINCGYCVDVCAFGALNHRFRKRTSDSGAKMKRHKVLQKRKDEPNEK